MPKGRRARGLTQGGEATVCRGICISRAPGTAGGFRLQTEAITRLHNLGHLAVSVTPATGHDLLKDWW